MDVRGMNSQQQPAKEFVEQHWSDNANAIKKTWPDLKTW
jgi:hypothetical protein